MADDITLVLMDAQGMALREIARPKATQRDVARTYALLLFTPTDIEQDQWRAINEAIIRRWSPSGLSRIKDAAWKRKWRGKPLFEEPGA